MKITINNNITVENTEQGYPFWFTIRQGQDEVKFSNKDARAICDALRNCIEEVERIDSK